MFRPLGSGAGPVSFLRDDANEKESSLMPSRLNRRDFVRLSATGVGAAALLSGRRPAAAATSAYPDWLPASAKPPKRGGTMPRAPARGPPGTAPRPPPWHDAAQYYRPHRPARSLQRFRHPDGVPIRGTP